MFKTEKLKFDQALKEAQAREKAVENARNSSKAWDPKSNTLAEVYKILANEEKTKLRQKKSQINSKQGEFKCYRCNRSNHKTSECRFKNVKCNGCGKQGHIQAVCQSKPVNYIGEQSQAEDATSCQYSSKDEMTTTKHLFYHEDFFAIRAESKKTNATERADPEFLDVKLNDKLIAMEIDTGTYYSVISENFKERYFPNHRTETTNAILRGYDERVFKISGELRNIVVTLFNETRQLSCYVMSGTGPPLIGRQWLMALGCWPLSRLLNKMNDNKILKMNESNI
uniref:CCHC-type domain-containing protein n=1 Tax=Trichogramma kaykai TaxID=54128 RepID=A0ABD2WNG6_9HYME